MIAYDLPRRLTAEILGTTPLVATVIGSGIMAQSLTKYAALTLLGNTIATGADVDGHGPEPIERTPRERAVRRRRPHARIASL